MTLDDIAREAGLSKATVSRALSGHPRVAAETRERIQTIAKELGYQPDAALSALARRRWPGGRKPANTRLVYLHNLTTHHHGRLDRYRESAAELGYELEIENLDEIGDLHRYGKQLDRRGVRGVILHSRYDEDPGAAKLTKCARVVIGFSFEGLEAHRVMPDFNFNFRLAVEQVVEHGYRRVGFINTETPSRNRMRLLGDHIRLGRWHLQEAYGVQPRPLIYRPGEGSEVLEHWLGEERPDVVICDHADRCEQLLDMGSTLPRGLGVVGLVNRGRVTNTDRLSQVSTRRITIFRHALHVLHDALLREEYGAPKVPVRTLIPGWWHEGRTLPYR